MRRLDFIKSLVLAPLVLNIPPLTGKPTPRNGMLFSAMIGYEDNGHPVSDGFHLDFKDVNKDIIKDYIERTAIAGGGEITEIDYINAFHRIGAWSFVCCHFRMTGFNADLVRDVFSATQWFDALRAKNHICFRLGEYGVRKKMHVYIPEYRQRISFHGPKQYVEWAESKGYVYR